MEKITTILQWIADGIDIIGIIILLFGFVKIILKYIKTEIKNIMHTRVRKLQHIRCEIGIYILLALDFLITSDIIHTVTDINRDQLIELSVIIVLRIAIGYFLGKEVEELELEKEK